MDLKKGVLNYLVLSDEILNIRRISVQKEDDLIFNKLILRFQWHIQMSSNGYEKFQPHAKRERL